MIGANRAIGLLLGEAIVCYPNPVNPEPSTIHSMNP